VALTPAEIGTLSTVGRLLALQDRGSWKCIGPVVEATLRVSHVLAILREPSVVGSDWTGHTAYLSRLHLEFDWNKWVRRTVNLNTRAMLRNGGNPHPPPLAKRG